MRRKTSARDQPSLQYISPVSGLTCRAVSCAAGPADRSGHRIKISVSWKRLCGKTYQDTPFYSRPNNFVLASHCKHDGRTGFSGGRGLRFSFETITSRFVTAAIGRELPRYGIDLSLD
jgi:hypothetical protein